MAVSSTAENRGWGPDDVPQVWFCQWAGGKIYAQYQQRLKILNATDFGDLLLECLRLFRENDAVLVEYQNKFKHILVDEYQDTNAVQYFGFACSHKPITIFAVSAMTTSRSMAARQRSTISRLRARLRRGAGYPP